MKEPLSVTKRRLWARLGLAKQRYQQGLFVAEGEKVCETLLQEYLPHAWLAEESAEPLHQRFQRLTPQVPLYTAPLSVLKEVSQLEAVRPIVGLFQIPTEAPPPAPTNITVGLDAIQDPGNLGTIIRLCDWLGVGPVLCGNGCADLYNPKVVQATAGALSPAKVFPKVDLQQYIHEHNPLVLGTKMEGESIYQQKTIPRATPLLVLLGNEGRGLSPHLHPLCQHWVSVPGAHNRRAESLNVGISAAIILSHLKGFSL